MDITAQRISRLIGTLLALCAMAVPIALSADRVQAGEPVSEQPAVSDGAAVALEALNRWQSDGDTAAYLTYLEARDSVAATVARTLDLDEAAMVEAWTSADLDGQTAVLAALGQLGVPYRRYSSLPGEAFDCSGLTRYAWAMADIELERSSRNQFRAAVEVDRDEAEAGDLVWYPGHVMLYLGIDDAIVHSPTRGRTVEYQVLSDRRSGWVRFADPTPAN